MKHRLVTGTVALFRTLLGVVLRKLPESFLTFAYTKLLSPKPLRWLTNKTLVFLLPKSVDLQEGKLLLNPHDPVVSGALALGVYEPFYTKLFLDSLQPHMTVVDIGANLGYYTVLSGHRATHVVAFEPEPENFALLQKNIELNHLANTTLERLAIGDKSGTLDLYFDPDNRGKHSLLAHTKQPRQKVQIVNLDSYLKTKGGPQVSLIKIDIEGWEAKALRGMSQTLIHDHPTLFFEFVPDRVTASGEDPLQTLHHLTSLGYSLAIIDETKHRLTPITNSKRFVDEHSGKDAFINLIAQYKVKA